MSGAPTSGASASDAHSPYPAVPLNSICFTGFVPFAVSRLRTLLISIQRTSACGAAVRAKGPSTSQPRASEERAPPWVWKYGSVKPQRGVIILLRYAAIPRPRRPACRLQHEKSCSLSQRPGTPRAPARLYGSRPPKHRVRAHLINGVEDHVHILGNLSRTVTIAGLVEAAKGGPSKWMKAQGAPLP